MYGRRKRYVIRRRRAPNRRVPKKSSRAMAASHPYRRKAVIPRSPFRSKWKSPLAQGALLKFKYADSDFDMSTTAGNSYRQYYTFGANNLFDPDQTGVGVQPYGFDPTCSLFGNYQVYASKIKVRFYTAENPVYKAVCTVIPTTDIFLDWYDPNDLRVTAKAKQHIISSQEGITRGHFINHYCTTSRVFIGCSSKDADFGALVTSNPTRGWYWAVFTDTTDMATEDTIFMDVQITYYAVMRKTTNNNES